MVLTLPREERFKNPAPQRVDSRHLDSLKEAGCRNAVIALETQFLAHELFTHPDYYKTLKRWPRVNIQRMRGMAFDGFYPLPEDFNELERSLRGKTGSVHQAVRNFSDKLQTIIMEDEEYWSSTRWKNGDRTMHQDAEAVSILTQKLSGRIAFFGSARLEEGTEEYEGARWLSRTLVDHLGQNDGTSEEIVTGGGPGIMEAGNRGALEGGWNHLMRLMEEAERHPEDTERIQKAILTHRQRMQSIGVRIELPFETGWNRHLQLNLSLPKFPARKEALITLASGEFGPNRSIPDHEGRHPAFFNFKGGIGTRDEIWEVICLIQCGKIPPTPVFIVGDSERKIMESSMKIMEQEGTIGARDPLLRMKSRDGTEKNHIIYCRDEKEAAAKYVEWHGITPPPSFEEELQRHKPVIRSKRKDEESNEQQASKKMSA